MRRVIEEGLTRLGTYDPTPGDSFGDLKGPPLNLDNPPPKSWGARCRGHILAASELIGTYRKRGD